MRTLVLNACYEPLAVVSFKRALILVMNDKATVIEHVEDDPVWGSHGVYDRPAVIILSRYVRVPSSRRVPVTRRGVLRRDNHRCGYCGGKAETIAHVIPRSRGGEHSWENCVASCADCNHRKADKLLSELGWTLRAPLLPPKGQHWRLLAGIKELDPMWMRYLGEGAA